MQLPLEKPTRHVERRENDMTKEQATGLENRLLTVEIQLQHLNEKMERVLGRIEDLVTVVQEIQVKQAARSAEMTSVKQQLITLAERSEERLEWGKRQLDITEDKFDALEEKVNEVATACKIKHIDPRLSARNQTAAEPNEVEQWRKKIWDIVSIAFAVVILLTFVVILDRTLLNKDAVKAGHQIIEGVK